MAVNFKDGVFRNGSSPGSGSAFGNIKDGVVRKGAGYAGSGSVVGKVNNYSIKGADSMDEAAKVACYHFLVGNIF